MISPESLRSLADTLDDDDVFDFVAGAIADARDKADRSPGDRDSADVLTDVIAAIRSAGVA